MNRKFQELSEFRKTQRIGLAKREKDMASSAKELNNSRALSLKRSRRRNTIENLHDSLQALVQQFADHCHASSSGRPCSSELGRLWGAGFFTRTKMAAVVW